MTSTAPEIPVPVLLYHSIARPGRDVDSPWQVRADDFAAHMDIVAEMAATGRRSQTATQFREWLSGPRCPGPAPLLVTFDDGFADYADVALPILRERGLSSTLFVTTGYLDRAGMLSRDAVATLPTDTSEIGAHTVSHPHLDTLRSRDARREIAGSRQALEDLMGRSVESFAYPHGSFSTRIRRLVVESGFTSAHAVKNALSHPDDDPYAVGRFTVTATTSRDRVRSVLAGRGVPLAWRRDRLRTRAFRVVRTTRRVAGDARAGRSITDVPQRTAGARPR